MSKKLFSLSALIMAGMLFGAVQSNAQDVTDHFIKTVVVKGGNDENVIYAQKELVKESSKDNSSFEMVAVKNLQFGDKTLIIGRHHIPATQAINGEVADLEFNVMLSGKAEAKFYAARFPQVSYQYVTLDANEVKDFLEKIKQLRQNYIDSDTLKVKRETHFYQYRFNQEVMVSMSLGRGGSSAKYFELWIKNRSFTINSDKFILYLTEFLEY
ncbi:MAG: hypothetical protein ACK417_08385 [Bacteroidia bacterium]